MAGAPSAACLGAPRGAADPPGHIWIPAEEMRLLEALPDDLTHRILGSLQLKRDNAQRFLSVVRPSRQTDVAHNQYDCTQFKRQRTLAGDRCGRPEMTK